MRVYPDLTPDGEFQRLGGLGYTGSLNDRQFAFLRANLYSGSLPDMMRQAVVSPAANRNLLKFSEQFDNAVWAKNNASVLANAETSPIGGTTADEMVEAANTALHFLSQSATLASGGCTASIYVKQNTRSGILIRENSVTGAFASFDVAAGSVLASGSGGSGLITDVGGGWYRCAMSYNVTVPGFTNFGYFLLPDAATNFSGATYAGDGTSGIFIWGAQLELGSTVTAYQVRTV